MANIAVDDITKALEETLNIGKEELQQTQLVDSEDEREKTLKLIRNDLKLHSNCFNWIKDDEESFKKKAETVYKVTSLKLMEIDGESDTSEIKYNALELLSKRYIQAFLSVYLKLSDKVDLYMSGMETHATEYFEEKKYIPLEYAAGFRYVLHSLKIYWDVECTDGKGLDLKTLKEHLSSIPKFDSLNIKGQVAVMAIKQYFWGSTFRKDFDRQKEILLKIVQLDPEYFEWPYLHYSVLRYQRRQHDVFESVVTDEETSLILKAEEMAPDNPKVLVSKCLTLAEIIRSQPRGYGFNIYFAGQQFFSSRDAEYYLKDEIKRILELDSMSVKINITIAEIFSTVLPPWLQDSRFTKHCIEQALAFHPNSSKANNRMGIYYLKVDKNTKMAEKYFHLSVDADPRNFPALIQLLQTYMGNIEENDAKITELMEKNFGNPDFSDDEQASLLFQKGIFCYMKNESQEAVKFWIEAYLKSGDVTRTSIEKLKYFKRRYKWCQSNLEYANIEAAFQGPLLAAVADKETIRNEMINLVQAAHIKEKSQSYRGDRGGNNSSRGYNRGSSRNRGGGFNRGRGGRRDTRSSNTSEGDARSLNTGELDARSSNTGNWRN